MRASHHLGILMMVACSRGPAPSYPTPAPTLAPVEDEPTALVAVTETRTIVAPAAVAPAAVVSSAVIASDKQTMFVAGCNVGCVDCSLASYESYVVGTLTRSGRHLFPAPNPPKPNAGGYACGTQVEVGERVTLRAHTTEGKAIASWRGFFAGDACPCEGTTSMTCTFTVTAEIASQHDRIYCGATWIQGGTAQIGH
jgi:hypothetical protein